MPRANPLRADPSEIDRALATLFDDGTVSGYFTDHALVDVAREVLREALAEMSI